MAVKYFIKYFDVVGIDHRLNIYDDFFEGEPTQVGGRIYLTYSETDDSLEAIRGQGLSVELEANTGLTFDDLWSENQKTFKVEYKRNDVIKFVGWLNPEGFFEDYVNTDWIITFDCVDGLGYLTDLAFVDENGFPFTGKKTYLEILSLALKRTGLEHNINSDIQIRYTGLDVNADVLANVYANTKRYIKDDGDTIMSCDEVIRDILEPFGAVLTSLNGEWYIYKPNQLFSYSEASFYRYDYLGVPLSPANKQEVLSQSIGSNFNGASIHHINANQSMRNISSLGAYRVNYKYGLLKSLFDNTDLYSADGVTLADWVIVDPTEITLQNPGFGAEFQSDTPSTDKVILETNSFTFAQGISSRVELNYDNINTLLVSQFYGYFKVKIVLTGATQTYYLNDNDEWQTDSYTILQAVSGVTGAIFERVIPAMPVDGDLKVQILKPRTINQRFDIRLTYGFMGVENATTGGTSLKGEFHTVQRTGRPTAKSEDVKTVYTGDNPADIYEGTIYKSDQITPTETWGRKGFTEEKPLLQIMGEEKLRINAFPSRVFSGDIYGYIDYLSVITIDGLDGVFMPVKYAYDTRMNTISLESKQIFGSELFDIDYRKTFDYGNTVKPTIKG